MQINFSNEKKAKQFFINIVNALNSTEQILKPSAKNLEVNIVFVGLMEIKRLNKQQRNINKITDVLSFPTLLLESIEPIEKKISKKNYPYDINPQTGNIVLGDIVVCISRCKQQAKKYQNSYVREICYLCTHGLLHLFGYDHTDSLNKEIMRNLEEKVMQAIGLTR